MSQFIVSKENYHFLTWKEQFPKSCDIRSLMTNDKWDKWIKILEKEGIIDKLNKFLESQKKLVIVGSRTGACDARRSIVPPPALTFFANNIIGPEDIKVVIIGQDPYPKIVNDVCEAQGLSFSVPYGLDVPSSLRNIYLNLQKFQHMKKIPDHGCLTPWLIQGVFMINAAFTTIEGEKNAHQKQWMDFSIELLKYINTHCSNIVFLVWGAFAHGVIKEAGIDADKHLISISSHPSGLSCNKNYGSYPAFIRNDCFGDANKYLKDHGKMEVLWDSLDIVDEIMRS